jgi:outer membrane protein OmpA-like peptidoglycan-associated protein
MRKPVFIVGIFALSLAVAPACATKKFVRQEVGQVNDKVSTMGKSLEETQERVRQAEGRITQVDQRAQQAGTQATQAQQSATQAQQSATQAQQSAVKAEQTANTRADAIEAASRKLLFEVVLSEDQGKFKFGGTDLPDEAKSAIDQMVNNFKSQKSAVWIEIEGHTDNVGDSKYNEMLGLNRAEAVKRYLYEQHNVPLHKINVISYGEDKPAAPNRTRDGRAQNRRVVVKVLA